MNIFYLKIGLVAVGILITIFVTILVLKTSNKKQFSFEDIEGNDDTKQKKQERVHTLGVEKMLYSLIKVKNPSPVVVWGLRLAIVAISLIGASIFYFMVVYFVFEIFMILYAINSTKSVEDKNGLTYIPKTNAFLDMYIPAVNNGESVNQIMDRFVESQADPDLTKWWFSKNRDKAEIPMQWNDVIQIYNNGYYNEQNGFEDSAEVYQKDLIAQRTYYNNFKEKIGEITPIRACYYIFMPICLFISYLNDKDFWGTPFGAIDTVVLCGLLFLFTILLNHLHKDTCEKLF